jgi:FixJ family two-component response regulator
MTFHSAIKLGAITVEAHEYEAAGFRHASPIAALLAAGSDVLRASADDEPGALRTTIHVIFESASARAQTARRMFALGHHAEVYSSAAEFLEHAPKKGIAVVYEDNSGCGASLVKAMREAGFWLPVIAWSDMVDCDVIVNGVKEGVLDFMAGTLADDALRAKIRMVMAEGAATTVSQQRRATAQRMIARLSQREREVLGQLTDGHSNKEMARLLDISPRTVEIHRMKMMGKLGARSSAEAIRIKLEADRD